FVPAEGPQCLELEKLASGTWSPSPRPRHTPSVRFVGEVGESELDRLRSQAALAVVPSRSAETFGLSAAEAMAAGLPVAASRIGALPELVFDDWLAPAGDAGALAEVITRLRTDGTAGDAAIARARRLTAANVVAPALQAAYAQAARRI
ncbi:MAG: glycosyltransferase family 4 protein, partial [Solirubrobacteraceae bacterium]